MHDGAQLSGISIGVGMAFPAMAAMATRTTYSSPANKQLWQVATAAWPWEDNPAAVKLSTI